MATIVGTGISTKLDSFAAGKEAALNAFYQLNRYEPDILIVFISTIFEQQEVLKGINSIIKGVPLIGCSSLGTISIYGSIRNSVAVFAMSSDSLSFSFSKSPKASMNPRGAGRNAAIDASKSINVKKQLYLMFSDCLSVNGTDVIRGVQEILGTSFPIIGGCATDELYFQKTYQYLDNTIHTDSVVGMMIEGDITLGFGKSVGWQPLGKPHKITKAKSNLIKEIDKMAAVEIYEEYFEKSFEELKKENIPRLGINYPLGMRETKEKNGAPPGLSPGFLGRNTEPAVGFCGGRMYTPLVRMPMAIDDSGGLLLSAELEEGKDVSLMVGDKNVLLESTRDACIKAAENTKNKNIRFVTVFSDIARLQILRKDAQKEIDIIKNILGKNIPILGCYTCGEYMQSYFNNHSIIITVFAE